MGVLGKKYSAEILKATSDPRTAQEISDELDIPIATCYRRLESLTEHSIVDQTGTRLTDNNRRADLYHRRIERICFDLNGDISVSLRGRSEVESKLDKIWRRFRD